jgi:hypothetical protein
MSKQIHIRNSTADFLVFVRQNGEQGIEVRIEDGAWSFLGAEECQDEDFRIISLEEIINIDDSILELADMPLGFYAKRKDVDSSWRVERSL